jgi:hypothetical protein
MSYFFITWWESADGEHFEFEEFTNIPSLEQKINSFLEPDYCSWDNPSVVIQETKKMYIIKGDLMGIIPKDVVRKWVVVDGIQNKTS